MVVREGDRFAAEAVARKVVIAVKDEVRLLAGAAGEFDAPSGESDRPGTAARTLTWSARNVPVLRPWSMLLACWC